MMAAFVLDASMTIAWHFRDEATEATQAVAVLTDDHQVVVPRHWFAEVANGLLVGEWRGRATPADTAMFVDRLAALDVRVDELDADAPVTRVLPIARSHRLTVYDAIYLELAERVGLPLATLDNALADAARAVGVVVLPVRP